MSAQETTLLDGFTYVKGFIDYNSSMELFKQLITNIEFEQREIVLFGKTMMQPRLIKWYGDKEYTYSKQTFKPQQMPSYIKIIKENIEKQYAVELNSVLINYYRNEHDSMGKHSDDEKELGKEPTICSISLGEEREFIIINKFTKQKTTITLQSGSLLIMSGNSQREYWHELPKCKKSKAGRINLTFRKVY